MTPEEQIAQLDQRLARIENTFNHLVYSDRFIFQKHLQMFDANDMSFGGSMGTRIGTATNQKIAFWNKTPIIQPASANQAALSLASIAGADTVSSSAVSSNFSSLQTLVNQLRSDLVSAGLIKGSA